jgi:hypothetical protein
MGRGDERENRPGGDEVRFHGRPRFGKRDTSIIRVGSTGVDLSRPSNRRLKNNGKT